VDSLRAVRGLLDCVLEGDVPLLEVPWAVGAALSIDESDVGLRMIVSRCVLGTCLAEGLVSLTVVTADSPNPGRPLTDAEIRTVYDDTTWLTFDDDGPHAFISLTDHGHRVLTWLHGERQDSDDASP
jgi:hypothetical protein